ncbi:uncharacterized protein DUF1801 [Mucilaginibacter yixingensis]|uniref:Uncharacterized protein DUF1801 n=1 Tax=Mucilaginibacter yixingensis TaxID=1295612 RepID=A0A2T5JCP8_9SPHI|nr:DUF1801 domain-containing protein [Mucilaginibacter yixingensis]PTQ99533.1 uncharacterized protein DUF1801 [Mucilaginibacter yixingensis]
MLRPIDAYFLSHAETVNSCLQFLREHILKQDEHITEAWKYGMPFFCYRGKMFCYLWVHKKYHQPYLGIVEGSLINDSELLQEKRARMKILLIDAEQDIPIVKIDSILTQLLEFYRSRVG